MGTIIIFSIVYLLSLFFYILIYNKSLEISGKYLEIIGPENQNLLRLKTVIFLRFLYGLSLVVIIILSFIYLMTF
jgi:hypothetical protein